jgi:hypothetical protein
VQPFHDFDRRFRCTRLLSTAALALMPLPACAGGSEPMPKAASSVQMSDMNRTSRGADMSADSEVGGMNEEKTRAVFDAAMADLRHCFAVGSRRVEFLAGTVQFSVEVNASGKLDRAYLKDSTLGDRETERCMLEALSGRTWPKPVGGRIGHADGGFQFEADSSVRPPVDWSGADVEKALAKLRRRIDACKGSSSGPYRATMYVGTKGEVLSIGFAMPRGDDEHAADCLIGVLAKGHYPSPGSWPAKVTFDL